MEKKPEYNFQSPFWCPNCKIFLHIRKVMWFTEYDYWYLIQCKCCSEEKSGRAKALHPYVPFWEEEYKAAKRIDGDSTVKKKNPFKTATRISDGSGK